MQAIAGTGQADIVALADPDAQALREAARLAPAAVPGTTLDDVLAERPDGIVIATPSAQHARQTIAALRHGAAVFCQKPLGRDAIEARAAVDAARDADRLLAVDLSYRHTGAMRAIREAVRQGELGRIFAADLTFHNAYGPDKEWFYDAAQSGGGCVMDLGVHLVDLALWVLDHPQVADVSAHLFARGRRLGRASHGRAVEDYAAATLELEGGALVRLTCSWALQAGADALIAADFHGVGGGASLRNCDGSFYDFTAHRHAGTATRQVASPESDWGGRAALHWLDGLRRGGRFDPEAERLVILSRTLDRIYEAAGR